eukprot:2474919-Alexandrium_andersonii.AAC.2
MVSSPGRPQSSSCPQELALPASRAGATPGPSGSDHLSSILDSPLPRTGRGLGQPLRPEVRNPAAEPRLP